MTQYDCLYSTSVDFLGVFLDFADILLLFSKVSTIFKVLKEFLGSLSVR